MASATSLTEAIFPASLKLIGQGAYEGCTGLLRVEIPKTISNIGPQAFYDCTALEHVTIPQKYKLTLAKIFTDARVNLFGKASIGKAEITFLE